MLPNHIIRVEYERQNRCRIQQEAKKDWPAELGGKQTRTFRSYRRLGIHAEHVSSDPPALKSHRVMMRSIVQDLSADPDY